MKQLTKAVLNVIYEVKGIDKNMTVGTGASAYKGVSDQEVKKIIGKSMQENGLIMIPISIDPKTTINNWVEETKYGAKRKLSIFTEVVTKYLLIHESGESIEISGYGHGVDSQDKGAGKATTYALKYALLYTFLVPTGKIDDADNTQSEDIIVLQPSKPKATDDLVKKFAQSLADGTAKWTVEKFTSNYELTEEQIKLIEAV